MIQTYLHVVHNSWPYLISTIYNWSTYYEVKFYYLSRIQAFKCSSIWFIKEIHCQPLDDSISMKPSYWRFIHPYSSKPFPMQRYIQDWCWRSNSIYLRHLTYIFVFIWSICTYGFKDLNPPQGVQYKKGELLHLLCLHILKFWFNFKVNMGFDQGKIPIQIEKPFFL